MTPRFLDRIRNGWASENNPTREGYYIRTVVRTGRLNPGRWLELTDGRGNFWLVSAASEKLTNLGPGYTAVAGGEVS